MKIYMQCGNAKLTDAETLQNEPLAFFKDEFVRVELREETDSGMFFLED